MNLKSVAQLLVTSLVHQGRPTLPSVDGQQEQLTVTMAEMLPSDAKLHEFSINAFLYYLCSAQNCLTSVPMINRATKVPR